jgi:2-methylcitrate dehydratase PrpD
MSASDATVARTLGRFVAEAAWPDLPAAMIHEAKRALLNFVGCALSAADQAAIDTAVRVLQPFSGATTASLIGRGERLDAMAAAFVNAVASNLMDYDDTHLPTVIHPTAPVAAPALALGERDHLSGARVLHAFVLGAEVECRIGNAVTPGHYARGWHITSTCGVFGSAVAAAKLLGLDAEQTAHALGIAASQSAGSVESLTNGAKNVSVGNAARNGIFAALLAGQGYTAAAMSIEGKLGWARSMGDAPNLAAMTGGLGRN